MRQLFTHRFANIRAAFVALAILQVAGCSSSEQRAQSYYDHGKQLLAAKDYPRARIEFLNAVKYNKKLLPAWQSLAQVDELTHSWQDLVPVLHNIVELDPSDMVSRIKLGRLLLVGGAFNDALQLVNDVKDPEAQNADLLALKGAILFKLKDSAGAIREAQAALKIDPNNTDAMFVLAGDDFARGDAKAALDILNNPAMAQKNEIGIDLFKLQILEKTQDLPQAEVILQKLIDLHPKEISFKKELIRLYLLQHRNDDAEREQRSLVAADPSNTQAQLDLVGLLIATKGPAAAKQQLVDLINAGGDTFAYQIALARFNVGQGNVADAVASLKKLIGDTSSPDHVLAAQINLAELYLAQKQTDAADPIVSDILKKDDRNTSGLKLRAAIRLNRDQLDGAISDLRQALNDQPRATDLMMMLALAYERSGSIDLAEKEFADGMKVSNFDPTVSLNYVAFLRRHGSVEHAEDVLTDLASRWPKNIAILSTLAQVRLARQEWAGAQDVAEAIKKISANPVVGDELLGAALAGRNKLDESIVALQDAYTSAPNAVQPMSALVRAYMADKKPDQAIAFLQSVLKANPSNAEAYVLLGSVQLSNKAPDQALQSFKMAVAKQPKNIIGYTALTNYYVLQKDYDDALKTTRAGLAEQPDSLPLHLTLAGILEATGNFDAAITEYQSMLSTNAGSIIIANNLASLLADHRTDKASLDQAEALAASLQSSPVPQFKDTLGWVNYREGNYQAAVPLLETAAAALPTVPLIHYHLGMAYIATAQPGKAAEQLKIALDHAPDHELEANIRAAMTKTTTQ